MAAFRANTICLTLIAKNVRSGVPVIDLRGRLKRSLWGQASDHEPNHRDVNQGFRCFRQALIVDLEPTMAPQPSERTFHNPAPRHHSESVPIFWLAHDLQS